MRYYPRRQGSVSTSAGWQDGSNIATVVKENDSLLNAETAPYAFFPGALPSLQISRGCPTPTNNDSDSTKPVDPDVHYSVLR